MNMRIRLLHKVFCFLILILGIGYPIIKYGREKPVQNFEPIRSENNKFVPIKIQNFRSSHYEAGRLVSLIGADEFSIRPRKYRIFNIRPFNEAFIQNARLTVYLHSDKPDESSGLLSGPDKIFFSKDIRGAGVVTRGVISGLAVEIYKDGVKTLIIEAQKAGIDLKKKEIRMADVKLNELSSGKHIMAAYVLWTEKDRVFNIPGSYIAVTPKGRAIGNRITVDLDFVVNPA